MEREGVSPTLLNLKAQGLLLAGNEREAIATWNRSARIHPTEEAHRSLAEHYEKNGETAVAQRHRARA